MKMTAKAQRGLLDTLEEFANLSDAPYEFERFFDRNPEFVPIPLCHPKDSEIVRWRPCFYRLFRAYRDLLREAWVSGSDFAVLTLLGIHPRTGPIMRGEQPCSGLAAEIAEGVRALDGDYRLDLHPGVSTDWSVGRFEYRPDTPFRRAFYLLFRQSWRAKRCPQCGRYFVASRTHQRYCGSRCYGAAKQQRDLHYWRTVGVRRRQQRLHQREGGR